MLSVNHPSQAQGCFQCWSNFPKGCQMHRYTPLGYSYSYPAAPLHPGPTISGDNQSIERLDQDWRPNLNIIRNQDRENMMTTMNNSQSTSSSLLSARRIPTPIPSAEKYHSIHDADDVALAQVLVDNFDDSTSSGDPLRVDLRSDFPASGFRSQVGMPAAAEASKLLRKKAPVYFCPFPKCRSHGFTEKHNFKYHWNSHMGIKPHACSKCKRGFGSKWDLRRHLKAKTLACANSNLQNRAPH